jgi:hypothetical protein
MGPRGPGCRGPERVRSKVDGGLENTHCRQGQRVAHLRRVRGMRKSGKNGIKNMQNRAADAICKSRGQTGGPAHSRPLRLCGHHHLRRHLLSSSSSCWTVSGCCGCCAVVMTTRRIACCSALAVTWLLSAIRLSLVLKYSYAVTHTMHTRAKQCAVCAHFIAATPIEALVRVF